MDYIVNPTESPDVNYNKNYLKGVVQLSKMIDACSEQLPKITCPALIIQGDKDPTVNPVSGQMILDAIGSTKKELVMMPFNRHVIIRKENSERVFEKILEFVNSIFSDKA
jgi:carboxylesterase